MKIYLIGHVSPDLDSVFSAITYAEFLHKAKRYDGAELIPLVAGNVNNETKFVLEKLTLDTPLFIENAKIDGTDAFILVDHNEPDQRHPHIVNEQIIEIIDHHKLNINFTSPIRLDIKPYGCTGSIIYEQFEMYGLKPSEATQKMILACILSDTVGLKSSTTTGYDSEVAHILSEQTQTDLDKFTFEIFNAKSDLTGLMPKQLIIKDHKIFEFGDKKVLINQIETVEQEKVLDMKTELIFEMEKLRADMGLNQIFTVVTDILKLNSKIIYTSEAEKAVVEKAFITLGNDNVADIGPRLSRKKDIAPPIEKALS